MKEVLVNWVTVSSYSIHALDQCMTKCKRFIRFNTIISLAFSTASGSLSVLSYSKDVSLVLNILLTFFSFTVAVLGSVIKVYQYQERLEIYIKTKQDWINFATNISTEMELPDDLRSMDDKSLLSKYKNEYNKLLQIDYELFGDIKSKNKKEPPEENVSIPKSNGLRIHAILLYIANKFKKKEKTPPDIEEGTLESHPTEG
jgi:hypothetical protein